MKPLLILSASLAVVAAIAAWFAVPKYGNDAYLSCGLAALIVWVACGFGLLVAALAPNHHARLNALMGGMLVRMGLPLASLFIVPGSSGRLAEAGFANLLLVFFLAGLLIETPLLVGIIRRAQSGEQSGTGEDKRSSDNVANGAAT
ncbi:MAG: hypothetical protein RH917_15590 [Lacipirellulaceae bacterium]